MLARLRTAGLLTLFGLLVGWSVYARLTLASQYYGNYDQESYEMVVRAVQSGGSAYTTGRYNYSPLWYRNLVLLDHVHRWTGVPFHTVVRGYLTLVDLLTAAAIFLLCRRRGGRPYLASLLFLLNPITVYVTGYHGQFDNLSILFVLLALLCFVEGERATRRSTLVTALLLAVSILVKHVTLFVPLVFVLRLRGLSRRALFLLACYAPLALSLLRHWIREPAAIRRHVLGYSGGISEWGLVPLLDALRIDVEPRTYDLLLAGALCAAGLWWSRGDVARSCALSMLALFVLVPSFANQYLVWPVALGAITPSWLYGAFLTYGASFLWGPVSPRGPSIGPIPEVAPGWEWTLFAGATVVWSISVFWFADLLLRWRASAGERRLPRRLVALAATTIAVLAVVLIVRTGPPRLLVACDNRAEVWVDGERAGATDQWERPIALPFPRGRDRVLVAVHAINGGGDGGLIGKVTVRPLAGERMLPASWVCSPVEEAGWTRADFDDGSWQPAQVIAEYGEGPWGRRAGSSLAGASWVWQSVPAAPEDQMYCRWWATLPPSQHGAE